MFPETMVDRETVKKILNDWMRKMSPFLSKKYEGKEILVLLDQVKKEIDKLTYYIPEEFYPEWRNPENAPPEVETEVLILYRNEISGCGITTAHYENGNVFSEDSKWYWEDLPDYGTYDEERDDYRIPEGWWEYRHFAPDEVYNNQIDRPVVGWMPLPPKGEQK